MAYQKITTGFVIQTFDDDGWCMAQEFVAGDDVAYCTVSGDTLDENDTFLAGDEYCSFDMIQPEYPR